MGALLTIGAAIVLLSAFARFVIEGVGTSAPVAPTRHLVVGDLYRFVRNPMYIAVVTAIVGQGLLLGQLGLLLYAAAAGLVWSGSRAGWRSRRCSSASVPSTRSTRKRCPVGGPASAPGSGPNRLFRTRG